MNLYLSEISEKLNRFDESILYFKLYLNENNNLNKEQINFLNLIYKEKCEILRISLKTILNLLENESICEINERKIELEILKNKIILEIEEICKDLINLIDNKLIINENNKIFYLKLKADFYKYWSETNFKKDLIEKSKEFYLNCLKLLENSSKIDIFYLNIILNYSLLLNDIYLNKNLAIELLNNTLINIKEIIKNENLEINFELNNILNLIKDNLILWSEEN